MPANTEKSVRKDLAALESALNETPPEVQNCEAAFNVLRDHVKQLLTDHPPPLKLSERQWSEALLAQARDDLTAAEALARVQGPPSVLAMLLQMVFEKLAKAALARTDVPSFNANRTSHAVASRLVSTIKTHNAFLKLRIDFNLATGLMTSFPEPNTVPKQVPSMF